MGGFGRTGRGRRGTLLVLAIAAVLLGRVDAYANAEQAGRIEGIHMKRDGAATKIFIMLSRPLAFDVRVLDGEAARKSARRLVLDFANATLAPQALTPIEVDDSRLRQIRPGQFTASTARIVLDLASGTQHTVDAYETPPHVTIALATVAVPAPLASPALFAPR